MAAPRKSASVRSISDTPADVIVNLDTVEREHGPTKPYVAVVAGKRLEFTDPQEIAWQDLMDIDDPEEFARLTLPEEQREHFLETKLPVWKMNILMQGFKDHYGLGSAGNAGA